MSKLDDLKTLRDEYFARVKREGEEALKEAFKELFEKHPELHSVTWVQYTPYFNDGDACTFSVREFDIELSEDAPEDWLDVMEEWEGGYHYGESLYERKKDPEGLKALKESVSDVESSMPEDLLQYIFGDHCQITVTREGMEVSEYEHD